MPESNRLHPPLLYPSVVSDTVEGCSISSICFFVVQLAVSQAIPNVGPNVSKFKNLFDGPPMEGAQILGNNFADFAISRQVSKKTP